MPEACDGVLLVDKPSGPTSHDVVDGIRRCFGLRKVGHGGTLDPRATGLLVILVGRATRLSGTFMGSDKTYEGAMVLGVATDSHDGDGAVLEELDASGVASEALLEAISHFQGDLMQIPPMVSAVKKDGVPLYKLARKGRDVERPARLIRVYEFSLLDFTPPRAAFRVRCTKGTYVRSLCHDIGARLGCGAYLDSLRRTRSGDLRLEDAVRLDDLLQLSLPDMVKRLLPMSAFRLPHSGKAGFP